MHERGIAADEVDADGLCGAVQCLCKANGACTGVCARQHGDGRDGDALIHNRNAVLAADVLAGLDEVFGIAANFVVDFVQALSISESMQSRSEMPIVMVRTSRFSLSIIFMVSRISCVSIIVSFPAFR